MNMLVWIFGIIIVGLIIYIIILNSNIKSLNNELQLKLKEHNTQDIRVQFINSNLVKLVNTFNQTLKYERIIKERSIKNENDFKDMIANISHDLRTPLTAIKGYEQLMLDEELTEKQKQQLEIMIKHSNELMKLINSFFEYSRLITFDQKPNIKKINLTEIIVEEIISVIPQFEQRGIKINFYDDKNYFVMADYDMLIRVVQNLLGNTLKYSKNDVDIKISTNGQYCEVLVSNEVFDIKSINIEKIFNRFYTADKSRSRSGGLGLSIVKILTERMGGYVVAYISNRKFNIGVYFVNYKCDE